MITALVSAITGLVSGIAPDLLKEFRETRAANREMEFLKLNNQLALERAKLEAGMKLEESHSAQLMAEISATKDQIVAIVTEQAKPTGILWIDGFNALIRPLTALTFVMLFAVGLCAYSFGFSSNDAFGSSMTALFSEAVQATLGFMFGARALAPSKKAMA